MIRRLGLTSSRAQKKVAETGPVTGTVTAHEARRTVWLGIRLSLVGLGLVKERTLTVAVILVGQTEGPDEQEARMTRMGRQQECFQNRRS